jgi:serine protease inhibitor
METANRLYVQDQYPIVEEYMEVTNKYFCSQAETVDFAQNSESARQKINKFVEETTRNKIKIIIPQEMLSDRASLVLINAVYFRGTWKNQFPLYKTEKVPFHVASKSSVDVDMMCQTNYFSMEFSSELNSRRESEGQIVFSSSARWRQRKLLSNSSAA